MMIWIVALTFMSYSNHIKNYSMNKIPEERAEYEAMIINVGPQLGTIRFIVESLDDPCLYIQTDLQLPTQCQKEVRTFAVCADKQDLSTILRQLANEIEEREQFLYGEDE